MEFTFNASALGAGGIIHSGDVTYVIPSLASVALAPTGGEGRSVVSNYMSEELSFSHAETRVYGRKNPDGRYTTSSYVYIRALRVFDKLSISEMSATVTSTREFDDRTEDHPFTLEVSYDGVTAGKRHFKPKPDKAVEKLRRYEDLLEDDRNGLAARFNAKSHDVLAERVRQKKAVQGTIIETIEGDIAEPGGNTIFIPGLGTVIFGELMLKPGRRRLNLVRIELGEAAGNTSFRGGGGRPVMAMMMAESERTGSMTLGSSEGNGTIVGP